MKRFVGLWKNVKGGIKDDPTQTEGKIAREQVRDDGRAAVIYLMPNLEQVEGSRGSDRRICPHTYIMTYKDFFRMKTSGLKGRRNP